MRSKILLFSVVVLCCLPALGQEKKPPPERFDPEQQEPTFETPLPPGEYFYKPEGRRDPFMNLLNLGKSRENRQAIEGVGGMFIDELELEGIIKAYGSYRAMLKGPDNKPYVVQVGDKVYDGEVVAIDSNSISFKKTSAMIIAGQKEKVVTKTLNPEKEEG